MSIEIERANLKTVEIKNMVLNGYKLELKDLQYLKIADLDLLSSCAREIKEFFLLQILNSVPLSMQKAASAVKIVVFVHNHHTMTQI